MHQNASTLRNRTPFCFRQHEMHSFLPFSYNNNNILVIVVKLNVLRVRGGVDGDGAEHFISGKHNFSESSLQYFLFLFLNISLDF